MQSVAATERKVSRQSSRHGAEDPEQHRELRRRHRLVGRRHDAALPVASRNVTSGWPGLASIRFASVDDARDRLGLVIRAEDHDRDDAAVGVEQAGRGRHVGHRLGEHRRIPRQHAPLRTALVPAGVERPGHAREVDRRLHALDVGHAPGELVDRGHDVEVDAALGLGLGDDRQDVDADRELRGHQRRVACCSASRNAARARRGAGRRSRRRCPSTSRRRRAPRRRRRSTAAGRGAAAFATKAPERRHVVDAPLQAIVVARRIANVGEHHRQQDEIGQQDHRRRRGWRRWRSPG